jgi:hypothetical protein
MKKKATTNTESIPASEYLIVNSGGKYARALENLAKNGVDKPTEYEILCEYDRLGGLITKGGDKVPMGTFWDFVTGRAKPEVVEEEPKRKAKEPKAE